MTTPRKQCLISAFAAVAILTLFACGDSGPERATEAGVFHRSEAGTIPVYPGSQPAGPAESKDDTLTQTFSVAANPADISRFYTDSLDNWVPIQPIAPSAVGGNSYLAVWQHGNDRLRLTTDNPAREAGDAPQIRYSLTLEG